jgi:penicillin-binding protein 1A
VGFDDEQSLGRGEDGANTAVPIWMHFMREALRSVPSSKLPRPGGLIDLKISPFTGALADPQDPDAIYEHFMLNHQPRMGESGDAMGPSAGPGGPQGKSNGEPLF